MSTPQQQAAAQGFSLFPSPNSSRPPRSQTPLSRRSESRERITPPKQAVSPEASQPVRYASPTPPRAGARQTPQRMQIPAASEPVQQEQPQQELPQERPQQRPHQERPPLFPLDTRDPRRRQDFAVQQPRQTGEVPGRTDTAFSQANTLVRSSSARSRSSIAKLPLADDQPSSSGRPHPQPLRSIFPTYNPDVPLEQQDYLPTQMSPRRIPRAVISRQNYHGDPDVEPENDEQNARGRQVRSPSRSLMNAGEGNHQWRPAREAPTVPKPCTTEQLKSLWKVTNGWKASASEGRVYCLKLAQEKDAPVYTLSSSSAQPFYNLRLDPTSASAYVSVTKYDPNKSYKAPKPDPASSSSSIRSGMEGSGGTSTPKASDSKNWHDALTTTLEEESRQHPPNDGLVATLMPTPATKMALEKANDPSAVFIAERECGRLVWDEDSGNHFLVHPALATPFCVTVERSPAWSRVEYTLEHHESPQHIAKLTRDGTGGGWLELDTGIASKIESFYLVDVAVTALLLVAAADERKNPMAFAAAESTFEPPPAPPTAAVLGRGRDSGGTLSKLGLRDDRKKRGKMEEFEIDVESQDESSLGKGRRKDKSTTDKLPFFIRVVVKMTKGVFKCVLWVLTIAFKCVAAVFKALYSCVGSKY